MVKKPFLILTLAFCALALVHFFSQRPLWTDELPLYADIQERSFTGLFDTLRSSQVFPRIHLAFTKFLGELFSFHVLSVRFMSLVFMLSAFFLWKNIYRRDLSSEWLGLLSLLAFAGSYRMGYFAAELKPYSADVCAVALFALFLPKLLQWGKEKDHYMWLTIVLLPLSMFFSYVAMIVCWLVPFNFLLKALEDKRYWKFMIASVVIIGLCLGLNYVVDLQHSLKHTDDYHGYWGSYFLNTTSFSEFFSSLGQGIRRLTAYWFGFTKYHLRFATIFIPFFLYGLFRYGWQSLKQHGFKVVNFQALGLVLFAEIFVLGIFKKYPFTGERITLFFAPFVFYYIVQAIQDIPYKWTQRTMFGLWIGFCVMCFFTAGYKFLTMY